MVDLLSSRLLEMTVLQRRAPLRNSIALALMFLASTASGADPFEIQVYDGTADASGAPGIEFHVNDWATGQRGSHQPEVPLNGQLHVTVEPSIGLASFWEIGAYFQGALRENDSVAGFAGTKLRSKFVTPPNWDPHWRLGLNLEVSYLPQAYDADRWGSEVRPIAAWHDADWLLALNPIFDQSLAGRGLALGPSFQPAFKVARRTGPVALGIEYYATIGPLSAIPPWREQQQQIFEVLDLWSGDRLELNAGVGEGLTETSQGLVFKAIVGWTFDPLGERAEHTE